MKSRTLLRIIAYLSIYLGVPAFGLILNYETITAVLAIVYIFLLIPFGILRMIDFYRTNDGTTVLSRVFNLLFRVPLALFGFMCLVAGVAIIGWVLYNVFVERQKEYSGPGFILGFGSFGVAVPLVLYGWFTLRSVACRKPQATLSPEQEEETAERNALEERLLSPDWAFYEQHLKRPAPSALRKLFAEEALITSCGLEFSKSDGISTFNPLDKDSLIDTADQLGFDIVPFATSDCGDAIFLRPGKSEADTVFIAYHDDPGKGLVVFADSVAAMVEKLRKVNDVT